MEFYASDDGGTKCKIIFESISNVQTSEEMSFVSLSVFSFNLVKLGIFHYFFPCKNHRKERNIT